MSSLSPWTIRPEEGQGARKVKSYLFAGGAIEMKPSISGRRISSCMPIQAPKEKPPTQQASAFGFSACIQSSAEAASDSSPSPRSWMPWLRPTPRKLKRSTVNSCFLNAWYSVCTILLNIVPPPSGSGCSSSAIGALVRLLGV